MLVARPGNFCSPIALSIEQASQVVGISGFVPSPKTEVSKLFKHHKGEKELTNTVIWSLASWFLRSKPIQKQSQNETNFPGFSTKSHLLPSNKECGTSSNRVHFEAVIGTLHSARKKTNFDLWEWHMQSQAE